MFKIKNFWRQLNTWRLKNISEKRFIYVLSLIVGLVSGTAAVLLKNAIHFFIHHIEEMGSSVNEYYHLLIPVLGIGLVYIFVKYLLKDNIGHGVTKVLYSISKRNGVIKRHNTWSSMLASSITISAGGSVGAEAPVVLTGASIGSNLARMFGLNYRNVKLMIGCGAAGAIAGIFKAPLAGMLFTIEVLMLDLTLVSLIPLMISAASATTIAYFFMGDKVLFTFNVSQHFEIGNIGFYIILGAVCGFIALYFTRVTMRFESLIKSIKSGWGRLMVGAGILTLLVFLFPVLWGEGYNSISQLLNGGGPEILNHSIFEGVNPNGNWFIVFVILILGLKVIAMAATNGAGGVGGIFAPTMVVGSFSGYALVLILDKIFNLNLPESSFILAGMAGMMAGVMHSPMTAIFLMAEITGGFTLLIPLIITATISYLTIMIFEEHSIYTKRLAKRGELMTHHKDKTVLMMLDLKKLVETDFKVIDKKASLRTLVNTVAKSKRNIYPVVDENGKLDGVVLLDNIRHIMFDVEKYDQLSVSDLMVDPPAVINMCDSMEAVMRKFTETKAWNLPVLKDKCYVGFVSKSNIFNEYRSMLLHFTDE